jgi:tryptophan 2,3-dioxygenase
VYARRDEHPDVHRIAEQMCDFDGAFQGWLMSHFLLVRRTIGIDRSVRALDGFPTQALPARMTKPLFPELWDVRVVMTRQWVREGGFAPGAERDARTGSGEHPVTRAAEAVSGEHE